ncbi:cytochrome P450 [Fennellomyces sp. T-0311]|nr:cytochrome P450 [Fennellomyces sp. T-0311]
MDEFLRDVWATHTSSILTVIKANITAITISTLILISVLRIVNKVVRPPQSIRHIPYANPFKTVGAFAKQLPVDYITKTIIYPFALKHTDGIYSRLGPMGWCITIHDPTIAKQYLFKSSNTFVKIPLGEDRAGTVVGRFIIGPNILFLSGQHWRDQRKIANPAFRRSMPLALFGRLTEKLFDVMDRLEGAVDAYDLIERWTLDAIGNAGFGFDFDAISNHHNEWVDRYTVILKSIGNPFFGLFPAVERKFLHWFPERRKVHQEMTTFLDMIQSIIDRKRKWIEENPDAMKDDALERDLLTMMIEGGVSGDDRGLTDEELLSNICIFFFAGHDTTSSALSFAICFLALYPEVQKKAREEAIAILGDEPRSVLPTVQQLQEMSYINMVIKETLRMYGPVDILVPRVAVRDTELGGVFIPKGSQVTVSIYELQHNPRVWDDPDTFNPERFADEEANKLEGLKWLPFSSGSRQCIGMNFSMSEQRFLLPMLLRKYEWELPKDTVHSTESIATKSYCGVMSPRNLNVIFKRRY